MHHSIKLLQHFWSNNLWNLSKKKSRMSHTLINHQKLPYYRGIASKLILKLCVAVWCGFTGALFVFPGLRVSRMHWDALRLVCVKNQLLDMRLVCLQFLDTVAKELYLKR